MTRATIIRLTKLTDSSLIVHWFGGGYGLIKTVAKGARRPKSPFAGRLDLFFSGEMTCQSARRGDLHALREVVIHKRREGLRRSYPTTLLAAYWCQLLESAVEPEHPDAALHDLLERALDHLETAAPSIRALTHFERELAKLLGVSDAGRPAHLCLRDLLGSLPGTRRDLFALLSPPGEDLGSSARENQ